MEAIREKVVSETPISAEHLLDGPSEPCYHHRNNDKELCRTSSDFHQLPINSLNDFNFHNVCRGGLVASRPATAFITWALLSALAVDVTGVRRLLREIPMKLSRDQRRRRKLAKRQRCLDRRHIHLHQERLAWAVHEAVCEYHKDDGFGHCADYAFAGAMLLSALT
jgi:hypothetical protein